MENPIDFVKRPIAIVGMGMSGEAARRLLLRSRVKGPDLITFDDKSGMANYSDPEKMLRERSPKTLVVSPGYPLSKEWIQEFREQGGSVTSELALALHFLTSERLVCVTGSVGKSTTVSLLEAGLKSFSPASFVGGNIGRPLADYVSDLLERKRDKAPWVVLELSSYQLENCGELRCDFSAITYLTGNHLDRYPSREAYYETKWSLVKRTDKAVVLNENGGDLRGFAKGRKENAEILWTDQSDEELASYELNDAKLLGAHNQDNLAVAVKIAREAGWPQSVFQAMKEFPGLPHRMENLGMRQKVLFVNDSKATTIESVKTAALGIYEQMDKKSHLILLLGGRDKNLPWADLSALKKIQKLKPVFFGECGSVAMAKSGLAGEIFPSLKEALDAIHSYVRTGDTVLLSPGGTSLDEFKSFEERGRFFSESVRKAYP